MQKLLQTLQFHQMKGWLLQWFLQSFVKQFEPNANINRKGDKEAIASGGNCVDN